MAERRIIVGKFYRHFKGGIYRVTGIATHTETEEKMVIYQKQSDDFSLWVRPYDNFIGKVDKTKYPTSEQEYRFEEYKKK